MQLQLAEFLCFIAHLSVHVLLSFIEALAKRKNIMILSIYTGCKGNRAIIVNYNYLCYKESKKFLQLFFLILIFNELLFTFCLLNVLHFRHKYTEASSNTSRIYVVFNLCL